VPTPLVAFSVKSTPECIVGVMVTASHNPKTDNGYKVYWSDGVQIRPPNDKHIANCILENLVPWIDYGAKLRSLNERKPDSDQLSDREDTVRLSKLYFQSLSNIGGLVTNQYEQARKKLSIDDLDVLPKFAYTAMHGVGHPFAIKCFQHFHLPPFYSTPSQQNPDPQFPTVIFPNPEEKGALNESMEYAETMGLDLVLANDPDADRLAVAEKDRISGTWTVFTGDQTAVLLGHWMWEQFGKHSSRPVAMCASTVSSKMLAAIARAEGFRFDDTLTGFKYISSHSEYLRSEAGGNHLVLFGYEEAIGYCCGDIVNDKDGISALGVFAELCVWVYSQKRMNMVQYLQSLCDIYGEFVTNNGYYYCHDPTVVFQIMAKLRNGGKYLSKVGLYTIQSIRDLGAYPYDSTTLDHKPTLPTSKTSPMITLTFTNGCITQIRASGTEPKLKYYIELPGKPGVSKKLVQEELDIMSDVLLEELLEPTKHGLVKVKP